MSELQPRVCRLLNANATADASSDFVEDVVFTFVIYVVIFGVLCAFGLVGNTLSFLVMQWKPGDVSERHGGAANFLLKIIAVVDNVFLVTTAFSQISSAVVLISGRAHTALTPYVVAYVWPLVHVTQMWTVWSTVLIAANRYVAICRPFQASSLCSLGAVRVQSVVVAAAVVVYSIPRFLEVRLVTCVTAGGPRTVADDTALKLSEPYRIVYENVLYCVFVFLVPLLILAVLNVRLALELCAIRRRLVQRQLACASSSGGDEGHNLTLVTMVIVMTFIVCQTPASINVMLFYWLPETSNYGSRGAYYYFYHVSNLLISANSCVNFVIYCAFRKQFRQRLRMFCLRQRRLLPGYHAPPGRALPRDKNNTLTSLMLTNSTVASNR